MPTPFTCMITRAGPAANNAGETTAPVVFVQMTDASQPPQFQTVWFYAAQGYQNQILAAALTAISTQSQVWAFVDPPAAGANSGSPPTQLYNLYVVA